MAELDLILRELSRRPWLAIIAQDPQTRMFRVDWKERRKHRVQLATNLDQAKSICRSLQLHGRVVGFKVVRREELASPWVPTLPEDFRVGALF